MMSINDKSQEIENTLQKASIDPDILIITRTKGRPQFLKRAFDSVLGQTYKNWHHTVLCSGTLDQNLLEQYKKKYNVRLSIKAIGEDNPEEALNQAIRDSAHKYVAIHDDDDSWSPDFLHTVVATLVQQNHRMPIYGAVTYLYRVLEHNEGNSIYEDDLVEVPIPGAVICLDELVHSCPSKPICFVFEREAALSIGLFNSSLSTASFWDFILRMVMQSDILVIPRFLAYYHIRENALGNAQNRSLSDPDSKIREEQIVRNAYYRGILKVRQRPPHSKCN